MNMLPVFASQEKRCGLRTPVRVDLAERVGAVSSRTDCEAGMPYLPFALFVPSGSMRRILPNDRRQVLRHVQRIAAAAAVGEADVEQAEIGVPGRAPAD